MNTNLTAVNQSEMPSLELDSSIITKEYYVEHYTEFLPRYISNGHPTKDTMVTYTQSINAFILWCEENKRHPLEMHDYQMRIFLQGLTNSGYADNSISRIVSAVRAFFYTAARIGLIRDNPCRDIHTGRTRTQDEMFKYYTLEQIQEVCNIFNNEKNKFIRFRNTLALYLMGVEGLRNVEVCRMNDEDVNYDVKSLLVRGKGHNGIIYPSEATFQVLKKYLEYRPTPVKDGLLTPTFICDHRHGFKRITRGGLRLIMNTALEAANLKHRGYSCHVFRHSCGTNLYQQTKDLRVVQEQLRHRDPQVTARYAHVQERMTHRYTQELAPSVNLD